MKKSYDSKSKSRVALEALREDLTVAEIAGKYQIHRIWFSNGKRSCRKVLPMSLWPKLNGKPEIFNSDQGSQFTSDEFINELQKNGIQISMDGRGRCRDNAKMERFWWALKYEDIKIKDYISLPQLRFGVQHYVNFYNAQRIHSALQYKTPDEVYFGTCNSANTGYISSKSFTPIF